MKPWPSVDFALRTSRILRPFSAPVVLGLAVLVSSSAISRAGNSRLTSQAPAGRG